MAAQAEPVLAGEFEQATEREWLAAVDKALRGAPFERLISRTADGIEVQPLYTDGPDEHTTGTAGSAPFTRGFHAEARPDGRWDVGSMIDAPDPTEGNRLALRELARGATSLVLTGGTLRDEATFTTVLQDVQLEAAPVTLAPGAGFMEPARWLMQLWLDMGVGDAAAVGGFGADPIGALAVTGELPQGVERALADMAGLSSMAAGRFPGVRAVTVDATPYAEAGGSEAQELAAMLSTGAAYLRAMQRAGMAADDAAAQFELVLGADADVFTTVAKLRAARRLWAAMTAACGADCSVAAPRLTVRTLERMMSRRDPWVNLLRVTAAGFAAVTAGAETVITLPFDVELGEPGELGGRMARNTQLLLGEESGVGRVLDPAGGSWYVETLTEQLAEAAWQLFGEMEAAGGMPAALIDGSLADRIAAVREARFAAVATRTQPLTGVSEFPDTAEVHIEVEPRVPRTTLQPAPTERAASCQALPRIRWAEQFEALRDAADAATAPGGGERPAVFLANLGPVAVHTARASFAKNFFEAGGLAAVTSEVGGTAGFDSAEGAVEAFVDSPARLACICSSDDHYGEQAAAVAGALRAAGALRVYLAGNPGDRLGELTGAGVEEFIHVGVDVLESLRRAHALLGIDAVEEP